MFQQVPPSRLVVRAQEQDGLCTGSTPKDPPPFQAQIDPPPNRTFDRSAADRQLHRHELGIGHATLVFDKVVTMRADRLAIATSADVTDRRNDPCHLPT